MDALKIKVFPDSILRTKAEKVGGISESEKKLLVTMATTMYLNSGVGLAAVQVGIGKQLAVIDIGNGLIKMINPAIVKKEGAEIEEEGCLSVPGISVKVKRAKSVTVNFLNEGGDLVQLEADGLLARAIQHEVDHLAGILILDHVNPIKKLLLRGKLKKKTRALDKKRLI